MVIKKTTTVIIDFTNAEISNFIKILEKTVEEDNKSVTPILKIEEKNTLSKLIIGLKA